VSVVRRPFPPIAQTSVGLWNGATTQKMLMPETTAKPRYVPTIISWPRVRFSSHP
jgi:hypothetical protein